MRRRLRLNDLFDGQWPLQFVQMAAFIAFYLADLGCAAQVFADAQRTPLICCKMEVIPTLRLGAAQEKLDRVSHSLGEFVRSSKIYCH